MKSIKSAARSRGRYFSLLLLSFFLTVSLHSEAAPASAPSLTVKIRQINPASAVQQIVCASHQRCDLPIALNAAAPEVDALTISLTYAPDNLLARFKTAHVMLVAADKGDASGSRSAIWHKHLPASGPATYGITLYLPVASAGGPTYRPVADIELTAQPVQ
jgi:hypothetical protein